MVEPNTPKNGGKTPSQPANKAPTLIEQTFPHQATLVFFSALVVGLVLVVTGLAVKLSATSADVLASVMVATGIGLILAAFGGQATARLGPFILAGVAAITGFVMYFMADETRKDFDRHQSAYVTGELQIDASLFKVVFKAGRSPFYSLTDDESTSVGFVALMSDMGKGGVEMRLRVQEKDRGRVEFCNQPAIRALDDCDIPPFRIPEGLFAEAVASRRPLDWRFSQDKLAVYDAVSGKYLFGYEQHAEIVQPSKVERGLFSMDAVAQEMGQFPTQPGQVPNGAQVPLDTVLSEALINLKSSDADIRYDARDTLANGPTAWAVPIADALVQANGDYRTELGTSVALADMLAYTQNDALEIKGLLEPKHLDALLGAAAQENPNISYFATKFLTELQDPRLILPALELAKQSSDPVAEYKMVKVVSASLPMAEDSEKQGAKALLTNLLDEAGPETRLLIQQTLDQVKTPG